MTLQVGIAACAVAGLLFLLAAIIQGRRRRVLASGLHGAVALVFGLAALAVALLGANLLSYHRLTHEQHAASIRFARVGERSFAAELRYPDGKSEQFPLRGDEWQLDARVLKWRPFVNLLGFDAVYRLERLSGRYVDIASEQREPRTIHALNPAQSVDAWELARRYRRFVPWIDALYGSATFVPMADGAEYEVSVTQSGLVARPGNDAARQAVGQWH